MNRPWLLLTLSLLGCSRASAPRPDLVLIVVDTLRADRLGILGSGRPTSPRIDRLAREGALFSDVTSQSSWTRPSMVSLLAGRYVTDYRDLPFDDSPTLAEILQGAGYRALGAVGNVIVSAKVGFGRGFEHFDDRPRSKLRQVQGAGTERGRSGAQLVEDLLPVVAEAARAPSGERDPLLVYLHLMDPHFPYFEDPQLAEELPLDGSYPLDDWHRETYAEVLGDDVATPRQRRWAHKRMAELRGMYDHEVRTADRVIEDFLQQLEELGVLEHAVVALVADHGELLFDQPAPDSMREPGRRSGRITPLEFFYRPHGVMLDQGLVHTPLILYGSGVPAGVRVDAAVENIDLLPTLLELCDVAPPPGLDGTSLVPWLRGERRDAPRDFVFSYCHQSRSVRELATGWKLTLPGSTYADVPGFEASLHDLSRDPLERVDRIAEQPEVVARLTAVLEDWIERHPVESTLQRTRSREEREDLRALGYGEAGPDDGVSER